MRCPWRTGRPPVSVEGLDARHGAAGLQPSERAASITVGVVVPTHNSQDTLEACLASIRAQTRPCRLVVVDNHSTDSTPQIGRHLADVFLVGGPERSAQRNAGARVLEADYLGFIDSDMELAPNIVAEVADLAAAGVDLIVVPEVTVGEGFWAAVRAFERSFYAGEDQVEAARFFSRSLFFRVGGFDEALTGAEDWDLARRARRAATVGRTRSGIQHLEGKISFRHACTKKAYYAEGVWAYRRKHGCLAVLAAGNRKYVREPWRLVWPHPILGAGLIALKSGEMIAAAWTLVRLRSVGSRAGQPKGPTGL